MALIKEWTTVRQAIDNVRQLNGVPHTLKLDEQVRSYLRGLPRFFLDDQMYRYCIQDYEEGWYCYVSFGREDNGLMFVHTEGDNLDPNPNRVKTNDEALKLIKDYREIKDAHDIDRFFQMSDDHKYVNSMYDLNRKSARQRQEIIARLS